MGFRPKHLIPLLLLLIVLQLGVFYLRAMQHNEEEEERIATRKADKKTRVHRSHGGNLRRGPDAPRVGIVSIGVHHNGPSNSRAYAKRWGYDLIDAKATSNHAAATLRSAGGDPSFIRAFALIRNLPQYDWVFWHDVSAHCP